MANTIRIKRRGSGLSGAPASLENAELAFTEVDDVLYYGKGTNGAGGTAGTILAIGGPGAFATLTTSQTISGNKTFSGTVALGSSATAATKTAGDNSTSVATTQYVDTAVFNATYTFNLTGDSGATQVVDDNETVTISGGTGLSSVSSNTNTITINLDNTSVTAGSYGSATAIPVITVDDQGRLTAASTAAVASSLSIAGDTGTDSVALLTDTLTFTGGTGITSAVTNNVVTFDIDNTVATLTGTQVLTNKTINVDPSTGNVFQIQGNSINSYSGSGGVVILNTTPTIDRLYTLGTGIYFGGSTTGHTSLIASSTASGTLTLPAATDTLVGKATTDTLTNKTISGSNNTLTNIGNSSLTNSSITFGSTTVSLGSTSTSIAGVTELTVDNLNFNGNTITSTDSNGDIVLSPNGTGSVDVANSRIIGVAAPQDGTDAVNKNYVDNAITGLDWKSSVNLLAYTNVDLTGSTNTLVIDGHSALDVNDNSVYRLLLIGQTTGSQNGIYTYTDDGTNYTLVRSADADSYQELINSSVFVTEGTVYGNTGWVQTNHYLSSFSSQSWSQFSGAGAYSAGAGLGQTGTSFFVNVAANGGIEIDSDALQLKNSLAGNGLTYTTGVLAVGGTADKITINADSIDIASTYVGQSSITTLGTITTGTWQGSIVSPTYGGTGVNNGSKTITLGGNLETSGAHSTTLTTTGTTSLTLPTSGTLATLAGSETFTNKTINASDIGSSNPGSGAFTTLTANSAVTLTANTSSSSYATGTLVVTGGIGVSGSVYGNDSVLSGFVIDGGTF